MTKTIKLGVAELCALASEMDSVLRDSRLAKFFELAPGVFRLKFSSPTRGEANVLCDVGFGAFLASRVPESPTAPTQFAAAVRSRLDNAALRGVALVGGDRVMRFDFEKQGRFALVFEFIGSGNALLLDSNEKIVFVWKPAVYAARKLALRELYVAPPAGGKPQTAADAAVRALRSSTDIEQAYWNARGSDAPENENRETSRLRALEKSLEAQRAAVPALESEERDALAAGKWIKENRSECEELIGAAKKSNGERGVAVLKKFKAGRSGAFVEIEIDF
ncbi:MAG: NFACT family protein [Candidatus Micrarchaeota archaeon]